MNADTDRLYEKVEQLEGQQMSTNTKLDRLTEKLSDLVEVIARKEGQDESNMRRMDDAEGRLLDHSKRLMELEKANAGTAAERKLWDLAVKATVTVVISVVLYGAFKSYV